MLEHENTFYMAHQAEFQKKYLNKWLVIEGKSLWGVYDTLKEAAQNALQHFEPGKFMIHTPARDGMVIKVGPNIHTRHLGNEKKPRSNPVVTVSNGDLAVFPYA